MFKKYADVLHHFTVLSFLKVIGLHKNGYGRILAECMFTSKILYCLWVTLADENDNFVIETTKPLPKFKNWSEKEQIKFIRERILGKTNEELAQVTQFKRTQNCPADFVSRSCPTLVFSRWCF